MKLFFRLAGLKGAPRRCPCTIRMFTRDIQPKFSLTSPYNFCTIIQHSGEILAAGRKIEKFRILTLDARTQQELVAILPRLRRFALGLTRNGAQADDLVQNACEKAITRIDQWEPGTRLDSWVFRIIQTTHIDHIRSQKRRDGYLEVIENQGEPAFDGERAAEATMTLDAVRRAIYNLPEEQRAVIMLVSVEGLSYKEAAETLDIPMGTLTSRIVRARTALARMMNEMNEDNDVNDSVASPTYVKVQ